VKENPRAAHIAVKLHDRATGPFQVNSRRIKRRYIVS
jgi:hypothetical protein